MIKKTVSKLILAMVLAVTWLPGLSMAEGSANISLIVGSEKVKIGNEIKISVVVNNVTDLYGIEYKLHYDHAYFKYKDRSLKTSAYNYYGEDTGLIHSASDHWFLHVPLIRNNTNDKVFKNQVILAEITFEAIKEGQTNVWLEEIKAISSETYTNEFGRKDLKAIPVSSGGKTILVIEKDYGNGGKSPGEQENDGGTPPVTEITATEKAAETLLQTLKSSQPLTTDQKKEMKSQINSVVNNLLSSHLQVTQSTGVNKIEFNGGKDAIQMIKSILTEARKVGVTGSEGIQLKVTLPDKLPNEIKLASSAVQLLQDEEIAIQLTSPNVNLNFPSRAFGPINDGELIISITPEREKNVSSNSTTYKPVSAYSFHADLDQNGSKKAVGNFKEPVSVVIKYSLDGINMNKLGLYVFDEQTSEWQYIPSSKHDSVNHEFQVDLGHFSKYAIIEYSRHYEDTGDVYLEASHAIDLLTAKHIINGIDETHFAPYKELSRAEFATLLVKALGLEVLPYKGAFQDVSTGDWHANYIETTYRAGIIEGYGEVFAPNKKVTREEMAAMMMRSYLHLGLLARPDPVVFDDDERISSWAKQSIYQAKALGLIQGVGNNRFAPDHFSIRADAAVLISNLLKKIQNPRS